MSSDKLKKAITPLEYFCNGKKPINTLAHSHPLYQLFASYDADGSGGLTASELQTLLTVQFSHYNQGFSNSCARLMVKLFDNPSSTTGEIEFEDFVQLWYFIVQWNSVFLDADRDHSLTIDYKEYLSTVHTVLGEKDYDEFFLPDLMVVASVFKTFRDMGPHSLSFSSFVESILFMISVVRFFDQQPVTSGSQLVLETQVPTRVFTLHRLVLTALNLRY